MKLLILDTETTGLDKGKDQIIEIAAACYETSESAILWSFSSLAAYVKHNPCAPINGISDRMLELAMPPQEALRLLNAMIEAEEFVAIVAHNADFDRGFTEAFPLSYPSLQNRKWICSQNDLVFPLTRGSQHLAHLAADHGLAFGGQRHRALADVLLLCDLLRCLEPDDLESQVTEALKPRVLFQSLQPFDQNAEAKKRGFRWNPETRQWLRRLPADTPTDPTESRPFAVRRVEEE